ncbi:MAG TPA: hypothetical protein VMU57_17760 [Edaphobacter sp.]|uniref:hypothetical protein n=1 Tax=Edaphobacter sp. TaxID=1934404 RepID=UPI002CAC1230|nr:hypothetical protein [Edaphobacter sp.]HUZ96753.1 hypothetical protein [Edaphobacter sp.]
MLTISKPLSASQARTCYERKFASQEQNYWTSIAHRWIRRDDALGKRLGEAGANPNSPPARCASA